MEPGILSQAALIFRDASLGWAVALIPAMEELLKVFIRLSWSLLFLAFAFRWDTGVLIGLIRFMISNGFALFMVRFGWQYVDLWFEGVKTLGKFFGSPPLDPSAVASFGWVVADPIAKALANNGFFDFVTSPAAWVGTFAWLCVLGSFQALALILMLFLVGSYLLTAACPWFFMWWGFAGTRSITWGYIRLIFGMMNGLFAVQLVIAVIREVAELLTQHFDNFLVPGRLLTWVDYAVPLVVGLVLMFVFVGIPASWAIWTGGAVPSWNSMGIGGAAWAGASAVGSGIGGGGQGSVGGGGQSRVGQSGGGGTSGSSGQRQPVQTGGSSSWGN